MNSKIFDFLLYSLSILLVFLLFSCESKLPTVFIVPKQVSPSFSSSSFANASDFNQNNPFVWRHPSNWISLKPSSMRIGSFKLKEGLGDCDISVTILGQNSGDALPNVNRWLGQLNLEPVSAEKLISFASFFKTPLFNFTIYKLGPSPLNNTAIYVAMVPHQSNVLFVKMMGDLDILNNQFPLFQLFLSSIKLKKE